MVETLNESPGQTNLVVCRLARPDDTADVIELTRTIWDGHDYVPEVWGEWLADKTGYLVVAELGGKVVGLVKISCQATGEWWLQGLRVDPAYEGQHIASRLHEHILALWEAHLGGVLRLTTYRPQVRHLCERTGFEVIATFSVFISTALKDQPAQMRRIEPGEFEERWAAALADLDSPVYTRLMDWEWKWTSASLPRLVEAAQQGRAWLGTSGSPVIVLYEENEDGEPQARLSWLFGEPGTLDKDLRELRRLGAQLGYRHVGWVAPLTPDVFQALSAARFRRAWEGEVYLYEKRRPLVDAPGG